MRKLVYYDGRTHTLLEDGLEKISLGETNFDEIFKLVDIENDLAVAEAFYDEIEQRLKEEREKKKKQEETEISDFKESKNNNIIEILDIEAPKKEVKLNPFVNPIEEEVEPTTEEQETLATETKVEEPPQTEQTPQVEILETQEKEEAPLTNIEPVVESGPQKQTEETKPEEIVLENPINETPTTTQEQPKEPTQQAVNYDNMNKVPFVEEVVDL